MKNFYYEGQRFNNGNLNIRFSAEEIQQVKTGEISPLFLLFDKLEDLDTYPIGEEYCLSNYTTGISLYSCNSDHVFTLDFSDIENILMRGKTLKFHARKPSEVDREIIKEMEC